MTSALSAWLSRYSADPNTSCPLLVADALRSLPDGRWQITDDEDTDSSPPDWVQDLVYEDCLASGRTEHNEPLYVAATRSRRNIRVRHGSTLVYLWRI